MRARRDATDDDARSRDDPMVVRPASGYCDTTSASQTGCGVAGKTKGTFDGQFGGIDRNGFWDCVYACTSCVACNFISYSRIANDCSWYASCELDRLGARHSLDHISIAVRDTANGSLLPNFCNRNLALSPASTRMLSGTSQP